MSLKFSPQVQLEIFDEIVEKQQRYALVGIDLSDSNRKWNYEFLVEQECINRPRDISEEIGFQDYCHGLTNKGESMRFELHDRFRRDKEGIRINRYIKGTFWAAVATLVVTVAMFCRCNQPVDATLPPKQPAEHTAPKPTETDTTAESADSVESSTSCPAIPVVPSGNTGSFHVELP